MTRALSLLLAAVVGCAGCAHKDLVLTGTDRERHPEAASAREAFEQFRDFMRAENFQQAYKLLSSDSRRRYKWFEFNLTFRETRFGQLLRHMYTEWEIEGVQVAADQSGADVVLHHFWYAEQKKHVPMVKESVDDQSVWRVRFVLCNLIGMPESDERKLFPKLWAEPGRKEEGPDPPEEKSGDAVDSSGPAP